MQQKLKIGDYAKLHGLTPLNVGLKYAEIYQVLREEDYELNADEVRALDEHYKVSTPSAQTQGSAAVETGTADEQPSLKDRAADAVTSVVDKVAEATGLGRHVAPESTTGQPQGPSNGDDSDDEPDFVETSGLLEGVSDEQNGGPDDTSPEGEEGGNPHLVAPDDPRASNLRRRPRRVTSADRALLQQFQRELDRYPTVRIPEGWRPEKWEKREEKRRDNTTRVVFTYEYEGLPSEMEASLFLKAFNGVLDETGKPFSFARPKITDRWLKAWARRLHDELSFLETECIVCGKEVEDYLSELAAAYLVRDKRTLVFAHYPDEPPQNRGKKLVQWKRRHAICGALEMKIYNLVAELSGASQEELAAAITERVNRIIEEVVAELHVKSRSLRYVTYEGVAEKWLDVVDALWGKPAQTPAEQGA